MIAFAVRIGRFEHAGEQAVQGEATSLFPLHQPGLDQNMHVVRHVHGRGRKHLRDLARGAWAVPKELHDPQSLRSGERG